MTETLTIQQTNTLNELSSKANDVLDLHGIKLCDIKVRFEDNKFIISARSIYPEKEIEASGNSINETISAFVEQAKEVQSVLLEKATTEYLN